MATIYPNGIDSNTTLPQAVDLITPVSAEAVNQLRNAILAIEAELGIDPSREYSTIRDRLDFLDGYISPAPVPTPTPSTGYITVIDESTTISTEIDTLTFVGADVQVISGGIHTAVIYIPPPTYSSHWNTTDGTTTGTVSDGLSRTTTRISSPTSEGNPFHTGGWAGTNQATITSSDVTITSSGNTTGFGGNSTITTTLYNGDGSIIETYTTPVLTSSGTHISSSGYIVVIITNYAAEGLRYRAKASVLVHVNSALTADGFTGGRYHVVVSHTVDTTTDGTGTYTYTQTDVFLDTNPTTPSIGGTLTISETGGGVLTKYLSGIEYYILGSQFTAAITDIDQLNRNTIKTSGNLIAAAADYGLTSFSHCPFGTGSANFIGWTDGYNQDNVNYTITNWAITNTNYRYRGTTANGSVYPSDPWTNGSTITSSNQSILIDTYTGTSTNLLETFNDESRRHEDGYFKSSAGIYGSDGYISGDWDETSTLVAGEAIVMGGYLLTPNQTTLAGESSAVNTDWFIFNPGTNPNYTALGVPVSYYRTFVDTSFTEITSMTMTFVGTFVSSATADLLSGNLQINVWKIDTTVMAPDGCYHKGPPEHLVEPNDYPLSLHGAEYNFSTFNDYSSPSPDGQIRESTSTGGTVNATFGGYNAKTGIHCEIIINNTAIKIDSITVQFYGT